MTGNPYDPKATKVVANGLDERGFFALLTALRSRDRVTVESYWYRGDLGHGQITLGNGSLVTIREVVACYGLTERLAGWRLHIWYDGDLRLDASREGVRELRPVAEAAG